MSYELIPGKFEALLSTNERFFTSRKDCWVSWSRSLSGATTTTFPSGPTSSARYADSSDLLYRSPNPRWCLQVEDKLLFQWRFGRPPFERRANSVCSLELLDSLINLPSFEELVQAEILFFLFAGRVQCTWGFTEYFTLMPIVISLLCPVETRWNKDKISAERLSANQWARYAYDTETYT